MGFWTLSIALIEMRRIFHNKSWRRFLMLVTIQKITNSLVEATESYEVKTFKELGITEKMIEDYIRKNIGDILEDETLLIVGQQVRNIAKGRNDLVAVDENGCLVLIEIKRDLIDISRRTEPLEFQSIRYASSCATIKSPEELVSVMFEQYVQNNFSINDGITSAHEQALEQLLRFLETNQALQTFNNKQRIMLFAAEYDQQALSAFAWLIDAGVDISLYTITPYEAEKNENILLDIVKILPLGNSEDFYVSLVPSNIKPESRISRRIKPKMPQLMKWGIIKKDDTLSIKGRTSSEATIVSDKEVSYQGNKMKYNEWGQKVTGWSTINIYEWALLEKEGQTLTLAEWREKKIEEENQNS